MNKFLRHLFKHNDRSPQFLLLVTSYHYDIVNIIRTDFIVTPREFIETHLLKSFRWQSYELKETDFLKTICN